MLSVDKDQRLYYWKKLKRFGKHKSDTWTGSSKRAERVEEGPQIPARCQCPPFAHGDSVTVTVFHGWHLTGPLSPPAHGTAGISEWTKWRGMQDEICFHHWATSKRKSAKKPGAWDPTVRVSALVLTAAYRQRSVRCETNTAGFDKSSANFPSGIMSSPRSKSPKIWEPGFEKGVNCCTRTHFSPRWWCGFIFPLTFEWGSSHHWNTRWAVEAALGILYKWKCSNNLTSVYSLVSVRAQVSECK